MDAFGNPLALVSDLKESFQTLFFEGDFSGFFTGIGYGLSNSLSRVRYFYLSYYRLRKTSFK